MPAEQTVAALIDQQAERTPDAPAIAGADRVLTYAEARRDVEELAVSLRAAGVRRGDRVAVIVERGAQQLLALLAVWRSGAAYVCLEGDQPRSRLDVLIGQAAPAALLTDRSWPGFAGPVVAVHGPRTAPGPPTTAGPEAPAPGDPAYLSFTSGSTGTPKGVVVPHRALAGYAQHIVTMLGCAGQQANFASVTSLSTDLGHTMVFPALISGGCVHLVPAAVARDPMAFAAYATTTGLDYLKITPSHLAAWLDFAEPAVLPGRTLVLGGEPLRWDLVEAVRALSAVRLINHYGPTETTVGSLVFDLAQATDDHRRAPSVPIGRPISGTWAEALDGDELYIGGAGLALGYFGDPALTDSRFVTLPSGERAYRTGDRVRRFDDGVFEFVGRVDRQVKIRGHRVEPAEVESLLRAYGEVQEAAVVAVPEPYGDGLTLRAFVRTAQDRLDPAALRSRLARDLPDHLVPADIMLLREFPLTPSGKKDYRALESL